MPAPADENPEGKNESMPRTTHMMPTKMARTVPRALIDSLPSNMGRSEVVHGHQNGVRIAANADILPGKDATIRCEAATNRRQLGHRRAAVRIHRIPNDASRRVVIELVRQKIAGRTEQPASGA